jgi:hypothetical protein
LFASVDLTANVYVPEADGVPDKMPVDGARLRPVGNDPLFSVYVYALVPPLDENVTLVYAVPTVPLPGVVDGVTVIVGQLKAT